MNEEEYTVNYNEATPPMRKEAIKKLYEMLQNDRELLAKCTDSEHPRKAAREAWQALRDAGKYMSDPNGFDDVEVRIFMGGDVNKANDDKLVTIFFDEHFRPNDFDLPDAWRCSWSRWLDRRSAKDAPKQ
jgi:hypothetical protein